MYIIQNDNNSNDVHVVSIIILSLSPSCTLKAVKTSRTKEKIVQFLQIDTF